MMAHTPGRKAHPKPPAEAYAARVIADGCAVVPGVLGSAEIDRLVAAAEAAWATVDRRHAGVRNLMSHSREFAALAGHAGVRALVEPLLGPDAFVARAILFDKRPEANWDVPWHQDVNIAVRERRDVPGFGPWSVKAGVQHVQPPEPVLGEMLTVRLHLDDCGPENGALMGIPGTHAKMMSEQDVSATRWDEHPGRRVLAAARGDAVVMRPLLLHASKKAAAPSHRRVVHLEFASSELPGGLEWARG